MRLIPLGKTGYSALVDDEDYERLVALGNWTITHGVNTTYACRQTCDPETGRLVGQQMHQIVHGSSFVDHINGNGLDNQRANLRPADHSLNGANRQVGMNNTSGFKGVCRHKTRWQANLWVRGHKYYLGSFPTAEEAAHAYDAAATEHFGPYARLNYRKAVA